MSLDRETYDPTDHYTLPQRARWRSLDVAPPPPRARRAALLAAVVVLHALALAWLLRERAPPPPRHAGHDTSVSVIWLPATPPAPPLPRKPRRSAAARAAAAAAPVRTASRPPSRAASPRALQAIDVPPRDASRDAPAVAPLYHADGSLRLPQAVLDDLAAVTRAERAFDYQPPGFMQARSFAQRPKALDYQPTRFAAAWREEKDPISEALESAVEKTTATVRIPVPRSPGTTIVCKVSLLALGGACSLVNSGGHSVIGRDDPATLDAAEDRQCKQWWDGIVAAQRVEDWRDLRDRYEAACRKPLLETAPQPGP